ncbi:MAG: RdgB/HAM1 family non-canonical purine NTP pyrophosphatase [Rhizomicrobium sp.]
MKLPRGSSLVLASHNKGKLREIAALVEPFGLHVKGAGELGLPEPEETGITFAENAALKALAAAQATGLPALSDDSGLCVTALNDAPGVYSARWAGENRDFSLAMKRVRDELAAIGAQNFAARFVCALAYAEPGGHTEIFEGEVKGHLEFPPRGNRGFGYDPIFVANGMKKTFGEISPVRKHAISHRARAFAKLKQALE